MKREELKSMFDALRNDPHHHLGLGDIRLTVAQQDLILDAMHPLPPAEGAEQVQRCPVCMGKGLVPNNFYATTSGIGSTTQTYLPEKCRTCNGAGVIILPYPKLQPTAEGAERKPIKKLSAHSFWSWYRKDYKTCMVTSTNEIHFDIEDLWRFMDAFAAQQPTAEGAEEILTKHLGSLMPLKYGVKYNKTIDAMREFATLHAQRLAEKMVEEKCKKCKYRGLPDSIQEALNSGDGVYRP